jgi:hypothetical protein
VAGFLYPLTVHQDAAGKQKRLSFLPRAGQSAFDEQQVDTALFRMCNL